MGNRKHGKPLSLAKKPYAIMRVFPRRRVIFLAFFALATIPLVMNSIAIMTFSQKDKVSIDGTVEGSAVKIDNYIAHQADSINLEKSMIWMYWHQGLNHLLSLSNATGNKYALDSRCVEAMIHLNNRSSSEWQVKFLDFESAQVYAPLFSSFFTNKTLHQLNTRNYAPRHYANLLRLELLSRYGGIWVDTSLCPFVPFDAFISNYLGSGVNSFVARPLGMGGIQAKHLPDTVKSCHLDHDGEAKGFKTGANWFMASPYPHNPLVDEWLRIYTHHLTTLPNPNKPYFLMHCSLTQARFYNASVERVWRSNDGRNATSKVRSKFCIDDGSSKLDEVKKECFLLKKQVSEEIKLYIMNDYLNDIGLKGN